MNANMLLVHATAALRGYHGPSRQDARARSIATQLVSLTPPWLEVVRDPQPGSQPHAPGWTASMHHERTGQHLVVDGEVADALVVAWRARDAIGLDPNVAALIQDRLRRVAQGPYWRYPTIRLNQINWYARGLQRRRRGDRRPRRTCTATCTASSGASCARSAAPRRAPPARSARACGSTTSPTGRRDRS